TIVARVQGDQFFDRHFRQLRRDVEIDVAREVDGDEIGRVRDGRQLDAEGLRARNDVFQRLQLGYVVTRFLRDGEALVVRGLAALAVAFHGAQHAVLAHVV